MNRINQSDQHVEQSPNSMGVSGLRRRLAMLVGLGATALGSNACTIKPYMEASYTTGGTLGMHRESDEDDGSFNENNRNETNNAEIQTFRAGVNTIGGENHVEGGIGYQNESIYAERTVTEEEDGVKSKISETAQISDPNLHTLYIRGAYNMNPENDLSLQVAGTFVPTFLTTNLNGARVGASLNLLYDKQVSDNVGVFGYMGAGADYVSYSEPLKADNGLSISGLGLSLVAGGGVRFDLAEMVSGDSKKANGATLPSGKSRRQAAIDAELSTSMK